MKKLIIGLIICAGLSTSLNSFADHWHHEDERWHHGGGHYVWRDNLGWVLPSVIGGLIVYEAITQPVAPNGVVIQPVIANPPPSPYGYHWEALLDANCNCYKTVLVPN